MKFRKITAAALAAVVAASVPLAGAVNSALSVTASASEKEIETKTEGDWEYCVNEDGETVCITKYNGTDTEIEFPATLDGKAVTVIRSIKEADSVVADTIKSVKIPDSVTTISDHAFYFCRSLTSVTIPDSVTKIGDCTFESCTSLTSVTIPDSVTTIGYRAFGDCESLTSITIPDSVKIIDRWAFYGCGLISVTIPDGVTTIGEAAFYNCTSLTSVTIPNSVTTIGRQAFAFCTSLTSVTIPNGVTTIGDVVFASCHSLTSITIPDSVTTIGGSAFSDCGLLETVYYGGTKAEWEEIEISSRDNACLTNAKIIYSDDVIDEPATSESETSKPTSEPTESTVTPGGTDPVSEPESSSDSSTDNQTVLDVTLKSLDSENGLEGEKLDAALFGDSGRTWEQVEKIEFSSDDLFSVQFSTDNGGWRKLGEEIAARADDDNIWNTAWTLNTSEMAKDKKFAKVIAKDGTIDVTAKIYIKSGAEKPSGDPSGSDQQPTGIALAIAPVVLAASAAIVVFKKKK